MGETGATIPLTKNMRCLDAMNERADTRDVYEHPRLLPHHIRRRSCHDTPVETSAGSLNATPSTARTILPPCTTERAPAIGTFRVSAVSLSVGAANEARNQNSASGRTAAGHSYRDATHTNSEEFARRELGTPSPRPKPRLPAEGGGSMPLGWAGSGLEQQAPPTIGVRSRAPHP